MNDESRGKLDDYFAEADGWAAMREEASRRSQRAAWLVAGGLGIVAVLEGIALAALMPLKTTVPYTLMVDRQTGYVQALKPLSAETITPDSALVRSFLVQYVIAREGFDIDSIKSDYRKVALWSEGEARDRYVRETQASNPASKLATLPRNALVEVEIRSVSSLGPNSALVRFATQRRDAGAGSAEPQLWAAVIGYRFSGAAMSAEDRFTNPLGFQVTRYRRDAEVPPPQVPPVSAPQAQAPSAAPGNLAPENAAQTNAGPVRQLRQQGQAR